MKRTLAQISGRKPVNLRGDAESLDFPSRHARVAYLLKILDSVPEQTDPYSMALDRSMLDRLRGNVEVDPEVAKQELRDSVVKIQRIFRDRTIRSEINAMQQLLASDPRKVSYQKRVLKLLRQDFSLVAHGWHVFFAEGRRLSALVPGPSGIDDLCQFQHIAGGAPAPMAAGSVFRVRTDFSGLGHHEIQLSLRQVIELL